MRTISIEKTNFLPCVFNLMLDCVMLVKPSASLTFVGVFSSNMVRTKGDGGAARTVASKVKSR